MSCGSGLLKIFLFVSNVVFVLAGLALVIIGGISLSNIKNYKEAIPEDVSLQQIPILTIVIGSIILVISFLGCCGACTSSVCMLYSYGIILFVLLLVQIALGAYAILTIKDADNMQGKIHDVFEKLYKSNDPAVKNLVKDIKDVFKCTESGSHPCDVAFYDWLCDSLSTLGIVLLALVAIEVVGAVFSFCLGCSINRKGY
ncbi:23 kDa integral membrane protein [Aethina tumida]|uniref:23 kDa integral membrane protein n=1 Tax=Aethina tumida TaxID=116153 RepID=UPI0021481AE7|nr:23 kDa integral membrane protein [Aethina tumida]